MDLSKLHTVIKKLLPSIVEPPYDDVKIKIYNNKGIYDTYIVFNLEKKLYDEITSGERSNIEKTIARFEAYRLVRAINQYLGVKLVTSEVGFREKK